ncbi:hypothetical protein EDC01DRAFT_634438 [Geopyxis carbonaria]|nr:hypothetical protein EDC01DRAFT_634438 [Geopyxis carbonaria]
MLKAQLSIAKQELHQALTRTQPAKKSRRTLSTARYITQADVTTARQGLQDPGAAPREQQMKKAKSTARTSKNRQQGSEKDDIIAASDSEVEREVEALMEADARSPAPGLESEAEPASAKKKEPTLLSAGNSRNTRSHMYT